MAQGWAIVYALSKRTWSLSAFSEIALTIGWSAETRTKRRALTSCTPLDARLSLVYPGNCKHKHGINTQAVSVHDN